MISYDPYQNAFMNSNLAGVGESKAKPHASPTSTGRLRMEQLGRTPLGQMVHRMLNILVYTLIRPMSDLALRIILSICEGLVEPTILGAGSLVYSQC